MTFLVILNFVKTHYRAVAIGAAVLLIIIVLAYMRYCGPSKLQQQIDARQPEIVNSAVVSDTKQSEVNATANTANATVQKAKDKVANINAKLKDLPKNSNVNAVKDKLCELYPEDCK